MTDIGTDIADLGTMDGRVLLFGGPYSNLQATDALFSAAADLAIPSERMICTGDVVAYAGDAGAVTERMMAAGIHTVRGNCEESLGFEADDCGCNLAEGSQCDALSKGWYELASASLDDRHRAWMRALPRQIRFELGGTRVAVIHGGIREVSRWIFRSTPEVVKRQEFGYLEDDGIGVIAAGHCGVPFIDDLGDRLWLNAGVIGMPANDGTPRTWFILLSAADDGLTIETRALDYDFDGAARRMAERRLTPEYAETLTTGLWPNMDVMPERERALKGIPLAPGTQAWRARSLAAE